MKIVKGILKFILCTALAVLVLLSVLSYALYDMTDAKKLTEELAAPNVTDLICEEVYNAIEIKTVNLSLGSDTFRSSVTEDEIILCAREHIRDLTRHMLYGEALSEPDFQSDALYSQIVADLRKYAQENGVEITEGSEETIYESFCETVNINVSILAKKYIDIIPTVENYIGYTDYFVIFIISSLAVAGLVIVIDLKKFLQGMYYTLLSFWIGGTLAFVPFTVVNGYDIPSRIVLDRSPLKELIRNFVNSLFSRVINVSSIVLVITACLVFTLMICMISREAKRHKSRKHSRKSRKKHPSHHSSDADSSSEEEKKTDDPVEEAKDPDVPSSEEVQTVEQEKTGSFGITEEDIQNYEDN